MTDMFDEYGFYFVPGRNLNAIKACVHELESIRNGEIVMEFGIDKVIDILKEITEENYSFYEYQRY